jgi:hypothetical protein
MMIKIRVSSKGQVDTGTELELREGLGCISLHPLPDNPVQAARGFLRPSQQSRSLLRELLRDKQAAANKDKSRSRSRRDQEDALTNAIPLPTLFDPVKD